MAYHYHTKRVVAGAPVTIGAHLGRWAVRRDFSVMRIASVTGATRATVYSWFAGQPVSNAYKSAVKRLTTILKAAPDSDAAWSEACRVFSKQVT